jgi:outer membrane lipoprotein-sorting protein
MSEFKFSCPACDQHMLVPESYAGAQINCPSCQKLIAVPDAPGTVKPPAPAAPAVLAIQRPAVPMAGLSPAPAPTAYRASPPPEPKSGSRAVKTALVVSAVIIALAVLGVGGWFGYSKYKTARDKKGNPAAQVATPTSTSTMQALGILSKVHASYTNLTTATADITFAAFLNLSNLTEADVNPARAANSKTATRHPPGMPRFITNTTEISIKQALPDRYYFVGEAVSKIDRLAVSNTFAFWASDKGRFMYMDAHQRGMPATYMQLAPSNAPSATPDQIKAMQHIFDDPAQLTKIIKDLGQTEDESVNGQDCYTLTAKVLGQKVKMWVDKTSYLIPQWQITLGGAISDADIDDAFSLYGASVTNTPSAALDMIKAQVKKMTPVMTKIRGTITSTSKNIEINPALSADDFNYPVPRGVRLIPSPMANANATASTTANTRWRNACINNLRQIDAAKNQFALENKKTNGDPVTEADIKPYIKLDADGNLPKCPAGGKYTLGKVGETPTCSIEGHVLP